jgi:hypothetical protein
MERYTRVHVEASKAITLEIVEINRDWKIKVNSQEKGGRGSTTVGLHADSLEEAKQVADDRLVKVHSCGRRCGEWVRV